MGSLKVSIAHSGRQHSHQTAFALQEGEMLERFYTTLWYKPGKFPYNILELFGPRATKLLKKRYFEPIDSGLVEQIPLREIQVQLIRIFSHDRYGRSIYNVNKRFDRSVARRLESRRCDVFVGYETSCLESFQLCEKLKIPTILDQAQVHHSAHKILELAGLDPFYGDHDLAKEINERKDQELSLSHLIFVPSSFSQRVLVEAGFDAGKIVRIEYGYDSQIFKPVVQSKKEDNFVALFVGAVTRRKGIDILLKAWADLKLKNAELIIAGGVSDGSDLLEKYEGQFRYVPFVGASTLAELYRKADVFILPSLMDSFGIVVLEAMASGAPVIITDTTGACDIVRNEVDGFVIPSRNEQALKDKIHTLYSSRKLAAEMGRNAAAQAAPFTWERYRSRIRSEVESFYKRRNLPQAASV